MDTTNLDNDKFDVTEKYETPTYEDMNYMEEFSQSAYDENDASLLVSPNTQLSQTRNYLVRKTAGVQVIIKNL